MPKLTVIGPTGKSRSGCLAEARDSPVDLVVPGVGKSCVLLPE